MNNTVSFFFTKLYLCVHFPLLRCDESRVVRQGILPTRSLALSSSLSFPSLQISKPVARCNPSSIQILLCVRFQAGCNFSTFTKVSKKIPKTLLKPPLTLQLQGPLGHLGIFLSLSSLQHAGFAFCFQCTIAGFYCLYR